MSDSKVVTENGQDTQKLILRRTLYAAGAGLIPIPVVDTASILGVQVMMVRDLARAHGVEFKESRVKSLIGILVGDIVAAGVFKFIPAVGTFLGMLSGATAGAAATYALGKVFNQHFAQGGTLLDFDPVKSRGFFQKEFEKGKNVVADLKGQTASTGNEMDSPHGILEQNKALHAEILSLQQQLASLRQKPAGKIDLGSLQIIEGIGPKIETALKAGGITDLNKLASSVPEDLQAILDKDKGHFSLAVPETWPQQAALAIKGDMEGLKALQETLKSGKETAG